MSKADEQAIGAQEHRKIAAQFGIDSVDPEIVAYVREVGAKVAANVERTDVTYKFYVLDTEMVNAFALPGGYVYVTRGLLALSNSEAELAAVLGHEIGHITARHSAERYSHSVLAQLGTSVLSAALDSGAASQVLGTSANLYLSSYSRSQEREADMLGIRYAHNADYDPLAMSWFLKSLDAHGDLMAKMEGDGKVPFSYFSTHPKTADRVGNTVELAAGYPANANIVGRAPYFQKTDGLVYGHSNREGFVRDNSFYHPQMDFTFTVPDGFEIENQPDQIVAKSETGEIIIFDATQNGADLDAMNYLTQIWMKGEDVDNPQTITIDGKRAATGDFKGRVNNRPVTIRLLAVEWSPELFYRFHVAYPRDTDEQKRDALKSATYSLRNLTAQEKRDIKPFEIDIFTARSGNSVDAVAEKLPYDLYKEERFRVLNALAASEDMDSGKQYKTIVK